jgi:hypothetical protein
VLYEVPEVPLVPAREARAEDSADRPAALARPPTAVDVAAMRAEAQPPEYVFGSELEPLPPDCRLVVLDGADRLTGARLTVGSPPALAVVPRADDRQRAELVDRLGLRDPVLAGGGWDPATTWLGVSVAATRPAKRRLLADLVRVRGPALVVTASRERLDRVVAGLSDDGLRAVGWDPSMRGSRAAAAAGSWRSRRLDALVVVAGTAAPLGRARLRLLLTADPPPGREHWRDTVSALDPERAVLVAGPDAPDDIAAYAAAPGCRRAALLAPYGEPVVVPCGRCDRCAPLPGNGPGSAGQQP